MFSRIIPLTLHRLLYLLVQGLTGTFLILLASMLYVQIPWYRSFLSQDAYTVLSWLLTIMILVLWIDATYKLVFVKDLPETTMTRVFNYVLTAIEFKGQKSKIKIPIVRRWTNSERTAFLMLGVEFFFIPIMINVVVGNSWAILADAMNILKGTLAVNFDNVYAMLIAAIFLVDTAIFAFGYCFASKWLDSRIISVEPTLFGWFIALCTYPPFNSYTGILFPMPRSFLHMSAENELVIRIIQIVVLVCHLIFLSASVSLGTKASNLTHRGVVSRGTYGIVRHPAYTAKLSAWLLEGLLFAGGIQYFIGWAGFVAIYFLRAITEERHLGQDPAYAEYAQRVKYRFIPGVV